MSKSKDRVHPWFPRKDGAMVVVIPKGIREELGIKEKAALHVYIEDNKLIYEKI